MEFDSSKSLVVNLAHDLSIKLSKENFVGVDWFLPFLNKMKEDASVIIIKLDGERIENIYTLIISGKKLGQGVLIRTETSDLEGGLSYICVEYAKKVWGWKPNNM